MQKLWITAPFVDNFGGQKTNFGVFFWLYLFFSVSSHSILYNSKIVKLSNTIVNFSQDPRPLILVTNDDGYDAPGIRHLVRALHGMGRIVEVAPDSPQSGKACGFTAHDRLHLRRVSDDGDLLFYTCSGTPVDCVKLSLHHIFRDRHPDLIVSGINHGGNDSICVIYSGTMGAVLEGCIVGIPAIGFSLLEFNWNADFGTAEEVVRTIVPRILRNGMPRGTVLNVNIPYRKDIKGYRVCRQADGYWCKEYVDLDVEREEDLVFFTAGQYANREPEATDTDEYWLQQGYVSIVPCRVDITAYHASDEFKYLEFPPH